MSKRNNSQRLRIGIQVKSVLVLAAMVLAATGTGGGLHFLVAREILHHNDRLQADRFATGLTVAAVPGLVATDRAALQKLVHGLLRQETVQRASILDREGKTIASAQRVCADFEQVRAVTQPPSLSYELRWGDDFLEMGRPVLVPASNAEKDALVGGIRLVLDTRPTAKLLAGLGREVMLTAIVIVLCAVPLGQLLVWRLLGVPIRRLAGATRRLAEGDFAVRLATKRNDELGELAESFDTMAEKLQASRQQLRLANESLGRKVAERTAELERSNRRLREEMSEKEDFLRAVSHDLNAPLRNVAGMATMILIKHRDVLPEEVLGRLQRIQANVDAETNLLNELLELSRIRSRPQKREVVDFGKLFADLEGAFEYDLKQGNITLEVREPMPRLYVERNRMREVFQNLVENAVKYMGDRDDKKIQIHYTQTDGMHQFCVADNGVGVAPEDHERIFYVFRRAASAANVDRPGKGVGLALVRSIAQKYEGRAWVESQPPSGSAFYVTLAAQCTHLPPEGSRDGSGHDKPQHVPVSSGSVR